MIHTTAPPPLLILIGLGFFAGAAVLAWFSSIAILTLTRTGPNTADVVIEDKIWGRWPIGSERIADARGARSVIPRPEGSTSRASTTRFLVFDTSKGQAFVGPAHHFFLADLDEITGFLADPGRRELALRTTNHRSELFRFLLAQTGVFVLAALGALLICLGVRALFPDPDAGIGPV